MVQRDVLKELLDVALMMRKTVVFHSRDAGNGSSVPF